MKHRRPKAALKRALDLSVSMALLIMLAPLFALLALLVKMTSPGPVFFKQTRVGLGGRHFAMYKFRTMKTDADDAIHRAAVAAQINEEASAGDGGSYKITDDPRIAPIGAYLRKYSLDELPQLFNVVSGEMSLVGPRPAIVYEVEMFEEWMKGRMSVLPGMTGLWQVSGRGTLSYASMIKLDIEYIERWTLSYDIAILLKTLPSVIMRRGAA